MLKATIIVTSLFFSLPAFADNSAIIVQSVPHYANTEQIVRNCHNTGSDSVVTGSVIGAIAGKVVTHHNGGAILGAILGAGIASKKCQQETQLVEVVDYYKVSYAFDNEVYVIRSNQPYNVGDQVPLAYLLNKY